MASSLSVVDVPVHDVWARLASDRSSILIDVRTRAEWAFVGLPDLAEIEKQVLRIEWEAFPNGGSDPAFVAKLTAILDAAGGVKDTELCFICRSGVRSRFAALAMVAAGYARSRNVAEGFEGPLDPHRHRGTVSGWKVAGLPWVQS